PARPVPAIAFVTGTRAPLQPGIAVAITSGHATTVTHERPPAAWDTKPEAHQGDVPTSRTDTQNVFLCRGQGLVRVSVLNLANERFLRPYNESSFLSGSAKGPVLTICGQRILC